MLPPCLLRSSPNKSWTQSVRIDGRPTSLGLGRYPAVTLAMARKRALDHARTIAQGQEPRRSMKAAPTFAKALETVIAIHAPGWKDRAGSVRQWRSGLASYALPYIGAKTVDAVTPADVMHVLLPIWSPKRVTATRVRQRIGAVMKWAIAQGLRDDNPAGEAIAAALPKPCSATSARCRTPRSARRWTGYDTATSTLAFGWHSSSYCSSRRARGRYATCDGTRSTATEHCGPFRPTA